MRKIIAAAALCAVLSVGAQTINPITQAMLDGYTEAIKENPKDYFSYYQRGAQLYQLSKYDSAKEDILKAIENTPKKDADMLSQEYSLLADINIQQKQYQDALVAVEQALTYTPDSYNLLYTKGNIYLYLNDPQSAYGTFSSMQRFKSRSQEAYFGMAKAAIMMGREDEAAELIEQAEQADPTNYITFVRIGDLYSDLDQNENAAANYLSAFALADDSSRPLAKLNELASRDYPAFKRAIDFAISKSNNPTVMNLLRASLAYQNGAYQDALTSTDNVLSKNEGKQANVYALKARSALALNKLPEASEAIAQALFLSPNAEYYVIKSDIERANSNPLAALNAATKALQADPNSDEALMAASLANIDLGDLDSAIKTLNETLMNNADNQLALMVRAYANEQNKNGKMAIADYKRAAQGDDSTIENATYKALAQTLSGKKMDGDALMAKMLEKNPGKDACYYGAVYYSQTGDLARGAELLQRALQLGYDNQYNLQTNNTANLNISPLRHLTKAAQ